METHAKAVMDETSVGLSTMEEAEFLCTAINQAINSEIDESGYSPPQWVLGKKHSIALHHVVSCLASC